MDIGAIVFTVLLVGGLYWLFSIMGTRKTLEPVDAVRKGPTPAFNKYLEKKLSERERVRASYSRASRSRRTVRHPYAGRTVRVNGGQQARYNDNGDLIDIITGLIIYEAILDTGEHEALHRQSDDIPTVESPVIERYHSSPSYDNDTMTRSYGGGGFDSDSGGSSYSGGSDSGGGGSFD